MMAGRLLVSCAILALLVFCWSRAGIVNSTSRASFKGKSFWSSSRANEFTRRRTSSPIRPAWVLLNFSGPNLQQIIETEALLNDLDPDLVHAVIWVESRFNPRAVSPRGASGLMQLMPATAREVGVENRFNPHQNVAGGSRYLRNMLERFDGNLPLALAAYNAGPGAVERHGGIPPYRETHLYVQNVLRTYRFFKGA